MRLLMTGTHGLIGSALLARWRAQGHSVVRMVRGRAANPDERHWRPGASSEAWADADAVIHLAGARIDRRWTPRVRREVWESRVDFTRAVSEALAALSNPPRVLMCASAIGYYGACAEPVDERSAPGEGFVARLAAEWERAAEPARAAGIRVLHMRLGVVLTPVGGALARMLPVFRLGLGGPFGDGRQMMSWIHLEDVLEAFAFLLQEDAASGPYNLTAPVPVSNAEFARTLGRVLRRPAFLRVPAWALRMLLGAMAEELLLRGAPVRPARLMEKGFTFRYPTLEPALRHLLT